MKVKTNLLPSKFTRAALAAVPAALVSLALPVFAQESVVIKGGPDEVQRVGPGESAESEPLNPGATTTVQPVEPEVPSRLPQTTTPAAPITEPDEQGAVTVEPVPNATRPITVRVPAETASDETDVETPLDDAGVTAVAEVPPATAEVDVEKVRRRTELERELGILDSGVNALISLATDGVFEEDSETIDSLATDTLSKIAEYIRLAEEDDVTITYHYVPDDISKDLAWERSLQIAQWLTARGQLAEEDFRLEEPEVVVEETPTTTPSDPIDTVMEGRIEIFLTTDV
ncbi:MAG: hypothetical protein WD342_03605 [Verrucomicrobiales bacterium]